MKDLAICQIENISSANEAELLKEKKFMRKDQNFQNWKMVVLSS